MSDYQIGRDIEALHHRMASLESATTAKRTALTPDVSVLFSELKEGGIAVGDIERSFGKIGALTLFASLAQATKFLGGSYRELEKIALQRAQPTPLSSSESQELAAGVYRLYLRPKKETIALIEEATFRNAGHHRATLMLEALTGDGTSQAFSLVHLEPGELYTYKHNANPVVIVVVVVGLGALAVTAALLEADVAVSFSQTIVGGACRVVRHAVIPNDCYGGCLAPLSCTPTGTESWWLILSETSTCGCV